MAPGKGMAEESEAKRDAFRATSHSVGAALRDTLSPPERSLGEDMVRHGYEVEDERRLHAVAPHVRRMFDSLSLEDTAKLQTLLNMRPDTIAWISGKSEKELKNLDGTVDLISNSRTAGKVLFYVGSACAGMVGTVFALAKAGYDIFATFRGVR